MPLPQRTVERRKQGNACVVPKPEGIVGIGEYGFKMGRQDSWTYEQGNVRVITYGNPAAMPMYFASVEMRQRLQDAVNEVFGNA